MRAKLLKIQNNIALVLVTDPGDLQRVYIVDVKSIYDVRVGEEFDISRDAIDTGTEYSISWDVVIPEGFTIPATKIHSNLIARGIYTLEDFRNNQRAVNDAINVLVGEIRIALSKRVMEVLSV